MPAGLFARLRALWRNLVRPSQLDADLDDEMQFHVEMQAERLMRERRLDPAEARRQAYVAFGGVEKWKEAGLAAIGPARRSLRLPAMEALRTDA